MNNELKHYGVPGMKWGKVKKTLDTVRKLDLNSMSRHEQQSADRIKAVKYAYKREKIANKGNPNFNKKLARTDYKQNLKKAQAENKKDFDNVSTASIAANSIAKIAKGAAIARVGKKQTQAGSNISGSILQNYGNIQMKSEAIHAGAQLGGRFLKQILG